MRNASFKLSSLLAFVPLLLVGLPSSAQLQVDVPANLAVSGPVDYPGGSLKGEYWKRPPVSIGTDGRTNPTNRIDLQIQGFGPADGTFKATQFVYLGNDLTLVTDWLAGDGASFVGTTNNNDDGAYRFTGYINVKQPGIINMGLTSDDGSRITIGGLDINERDGSHGDETQDVDVNFLAAGLYPIEITYFNGDWTDNNVCNGNHDPSPGCTAHGGANFHLRMNSADITSAGVSLLYPPGGAAKPLVAVGLNFGADDNGAALGLAPTDVAGAVPQANWNNLNGATSTGPVANLTADSNGVAVATTISVEWTSPNTWASTGRGETNNSFPPGPDQVMMTGYIDTGNTDATKATVTVTGIPTDITSGGYDVLVYCLGGVAGRGGAYAIGGETKFGTSAENPTAHSEDAGVDLTDTGTYVRFRGLYGSSFTLTASADPAAGAGVNFRAPINGIQIIKSQDPRAGLAVGYMTVNVYTNIGDSLDVEALLTDPKYTNNQPDVTCLRPNFSANDADQCDNCGYSVRGFFIPSATGPHVFYIAADDRAALFLSTDEDPANKVQIARENEWSARRRYIDNTGANGGGGRGDPPANRSEPINLVAGNFYYIEGAVKEAGGGDNLDVAVQGPGDPAVMDLDPPISGSRIATIADLTGSSLAITSNPVSVQVPEGDSASFTVGADAVTTPCGSIVQYQWQRNGVDIPGANSATYSFGPVTANDHLSTYRAVVSIAGITRTSAAATLEVLGRECLRIVSASGSPDFGHISVSFSTFLATNEPGNTDPFNFTVSGGVNVTAVTLSGDGKSVLLTAGPLAEDTEYTVTVQNVVSVVGTTVCEAPTNSATFRSFVTGCGGAIFEAYNVGAGNAVSVLTSHPTYPNSPDFRTVINAVDIRVAVDPANPSFYNSDAREAYGGRIRGLFIAPETGPHVFYFASDDNGELWLSTDEHPSNKVRIARETSWSATKEWTVSGGASSLTDKRSAPINLQAGHAYYFEALYKEGGGGDNCAVAVQLPSQANPPMNGMDAISATLLGGAAPAELLGPVTITAQPQSQAVSASSVVTFNVGVNVPVIEDLTLPTCFQWTRDGVDIEGANGSSYTLGPVALTDDGAHFGVRISIIGSSVTSADAVLTVAEDTNPPVCVSASGSINLSNIVVRFNELMASGPAQDIFNYTVPGRSVVAATLQADGQSVLLQVDPALAVDTDYSVTAQNLIDLAENVLSSCTLQFHSFIINPGFVLKELYLNIPGVALTDLFGSPKYPGSPDLVRYGGELELNTFDEFENYGARMSGWLLPPVSGNYNFYMSSDDGGGFWLSTDASPANLVQVASEPVWNGRRDWLGTARRNPDMPENRSTTLFPGGIPLTAGQMYYFEALMKEGGGGDNLAVAWQLPGTPPPASGSPAIPGIYIGALGDPTGAMLQITQQPADVTVAAGANAVFTVGVSASRPGETNPAVIYQWYRSNGAGTNGGGFEPIPGANGATYQFPAANADNGARFRVQASILGATATSSEATLTVSGVSPLLWMVGMDDDGWPAGDGGGPNASFVQEAGTNPPPGNPASPEVNQQADDDYYFAGTYTTVIAGNGAYTPVGTVAANEEAAERAFAGTDNDLRYHFNLPGSLQPTDLLSVTFDALNLDDPANPLNTDLRYGVEVYFNGVLVQTQIVIRPAQLGVDYSTPQFTLASVNAQVGPGFDNIVSLKGINYNSEGGGNWMGIDYVQLNYTPGGQPPTSVISDVVETGGDNEPTDTITAKWTGETFPVSVANEPVPGLVVGDNYTVGTFGNHAPAYVDRNHRYTNASDTVMIPGYLAGGDYVMSGNDNRDNAGYVLDVTVSEPVLAYLLIDNRLGDTDGNTPPTFDATHMQWVVDQGWAPVKTGANRAGDANAPDEVGIDEGSDDTINQWFSVYTKAFPAGTFQVLQADNAGQNMYGLVVKAGQPPTEEVVYNFDDCAVPAGVVLSGVARVADDGTGTNCVLHLTDDGQCNPGVNGDAVFPDKDGGLPVDHIDVRWRSRIGGTGHVCTDGAAQATQNGPGADGYSLSWGSDVATSGVGEEGTGTGLIVAVDTFNNAEIENPDVAIDITYNGQRLAFDGISSDAQAAKDFLRKDQFVDARLQVTSSGAVTFTYDGRVLSAQLPGWTGIAGGSFVFGSRTGGAADNHWIDDLRIKTFTPGPITITRQPQSVEVKQELTASFTVEVDGTPPYTFQWYANGTEIPGATSSSYTTLPTAPSDNGTMFTVVVGNSFGSVTSAVALLTVNTDVDAPQCVEARVLLDLMRISVHFNELMDLEKLGDIFNYTVPGFNVTAATTNSDSMSVTLILDGRLTPGSTNEVMVSGVADLAGNTASCTLQALAPVVSCGFALQEIYMGIPGVTIADLRGSAKYPGSPDVTRYRGLLEANSVDEFDNYGTRISGWLLPPVSGNYNFYMSSDDAGEFWLSTDDNPANIVLVANEPVWNGRRDWLGTTRRNAAAPENRSTTLFPAGIPLAAGQMYYFEALMKEGGGGDNLAVTWQLPGAPEPANGSTPIPGVYLASLASPIGASITITQQPADQSFLISSAPPAALLSQDFTSSDGGFTVETPQSFNTPWTYTAVTGSWQVNQDAAEVNHPMTSRLTSPTLTVTRSGFVQVTFEHRYSFEQGFWDGGALQVSINGGDFTTVPASAYIAGAPNGTVLPGSASDLHGQTVFVQDSPNHQGPGYVTSTASLGSLNAGDTVVLRFLYAADTNSRGNFLPSWELTSLTVNEGGTAPDVTFRVGAMATGDIFYQWDRDDGAGFVPVPGANSPTLTLVPKLSDNGARFRVRLYTPGATVTSDTATLTVVQPNTPPRFTCGPNQTNVQHDAGAQTVPNWATDIQVHSIDRVAVTFASDFSALPPGTRVLDPNGATTPNPRVEDGVLKLTDALDAGGFGGFAIGPFTVQTFESAQASWKSRIGGGANGGADGYSLNFGDDLPDNFQGEEGTGTGLSVAVDTFDNADIEVPDVGIEIVWRGQRVAALQIPKDDDGTGNFLRKDTFVDASVSLTAAGLATFTYDGNTIMAQLPGFDGVRVNQINLGARTGGANDNHWIDDLSIEALPVDASSGEAGQTIQFIVTNDNPSLFSAQPAVSPTGTLTFTPAPGHCGTAHVTVVAMDNGGTANGGSDTSAPCTFDIDVTGCTGNQPPVAQNSSVTTDLNTPFNFQLMASDPDGDPLTYMVVGAPAHGIVLLQVQTGAATYTPNAGYVGPDSFTFKVNDGMADSGVATVSITVRDVTMNRNPTAVISAAPLYDFTPSIANMVAISCNGSNACLVLDGSGSSDPDGDPLTYNWFLQPSAVPFASGVQVSQCFELGQHTIELVVSDGRGGTGTATLTIEVVTLSEGLETLIDKVNNANIERRNKRPFIASLKAAAASIDRGSLNSAVGQLGAFQNKVRAQVRRSNPAEADCWIRWAQHIIDGIDNCQ